MCIPARSYVRQADRETFEVELAQMLVEHLNENQNRNPFKLFEVNRNVVLILWVNTQRNTTALPPAPDLLLRPSQGKSMWAILIGKRFDECARSSGTT